MCATAAWPALSRCRTVRSPVDTMGATSLVRPSPPRADICGTLAEAVPPRDCRSVGDARCLRPSVLPSAVIYPDTRWRGENHECVGARDTSTLGGGGRPARAEVGRQTRWFFRDARNVCAVT